MNHAPKFERMLAESGIQLTKFWFSVTRREQRTRFAIRQIDPVRRWKLSPMDLESLDKWDAYSAAKEENVRPHRHQACAGSRCAATTRSGPGSTRCGRS